jgi:hypothetical protein
MNFVKRYFFLAALACGVLSVAWARHDRWVHSHSLVLALSPTQEAGFVNAAWIEDPEAESEPLVCFTKLFPPGTTLTLTPLVGDGDLPRVEVEVVGPWPWAAVAERFILSANSEPSTRARQILFKTVVITEHKPRIEPR